jgi:hypothetical protein
LILGLVLVDGGVPSLLDLRVAFYPGHDHALASFLKVLDHPTSIFGPFMWEYLPLYP